MVNWLVLCESLCHTFAKPVHIVIVSHQATTSIIGSYSTCSIICVLAPLSDWWFGKIMRNEIQRPSWNAVSPWTSQAAEVHQPHIVTRRACSIHSSIAESGSFSATTTATAPCTLVQRFGLVVSISPGSSKVVTAIVAPSGPLHSPICRANVWMMKLLAERVLNAVSPSMSL